MFKPPVVFITGWAQRREALSPLAEQLGGAGDAVLTSVYELLDQDPAPEFAILRKSGLAPSRYASRLAAVLSARQAPVLVGWSMGALVSLETAYFFPHLMECLVLLAGTSCFCAKAGYDSGVPLRNLKALRLGLQVSPKQTLSLFFQHFYLHGVDKDAGKIKTENALRLDRSRLQDGLNYLEASDLRDILPEISHPVLIVHGAKDRIVPASASTYLASRLPAARVFLLPDSTHAMPENEAAMVAQHIRGFLP